MEQEPNRRRTIQDIAAAAGVSTASVSYALNGKPGVSSATRDRILAVAKQHNWEPNRQAQALHTARTDVVGFVVPASNEALSEESFWIQFISGLEHALRAAGKSLLLHTEPETSVELELYRSWRNRGVVDAVVLTDLRLDDARVPLLKEIGLPAVLAGKPEPDLGLSYCYASDGRDMEQLLACLHGHGIRRFARLAGDESYLFVRERDDAAAQFVATHGLPPVATVHPGFFATHTVAEAMEAFLRAEPRPQLVIADSDLLAVRALSAIQDRGLSVPDDVQVVAFDDSVTCRLVTPPITALDRHPRDLGSAAGRLAADVGGPRRIEVVRGAELHVRDSTRPLPRT